VLATLSIKAVKNKRNNTYMGFEVLTVVTTKNTTIWILTACTSVEIQRFGGMYDFL
jgi:hypothetical protein